MKNDKKNSNKKNNDQIRYKNKIKSNNNGEN
jgi:hypothetical protein